MIPMDSEPRITVLARASRNLAVSQLVSEPRMTVWLVAKIIGHEPQKAWQQDKLIGSKLPVVK
jgi:hypothetical protein